MDNYWIDEFQKFEDTMELTFRGIDDHLQNDDPDPSKIMHGLCALERELFSLIQYAKEMSAAKQAAAEHSFPKSS